MQPVTLTPQRPRTPEFGASTRRQGDTYSAQGDTWGDHHGTLGTERYTIQDGVVRQAHHDTDAQGDKMIGDMADPFKGIMPMPQVSASQWLMSSMGFADALSCARVNT